MEIVPTYDRSKLIDRAVENLSHKLIEEFIVVALVCGIFLWHLRSSLVAIISLPVGVLIAFIVMRHQGINANIMSLGGIAIAIGAMVDAAVVMIENAHKKIEAWHTEHPGKELKGEAHWHVMTEAAAEVGPALFFCLLIITAVALAGIYWLDSVGYVFSGVDIAFVGFPFLINALYTLVQATQVSVAGQPIRKRAPLFIFCVVLGGTATAYWLLVKNASGELATDQALYLQLTILFSGICFFLSSNFMLYWWRSGRVESSPFKRYFLTEVVVWPKLNLYRDMDKVIEPFNRQLEQRKSQHAAAIRRQQKGRPRKR